MRAVAHDVGVEGVLLVGADGPTVTQRAKKRAASLRGVRSLPTRGRREVNRRRSHTRLVRHAGRRSSGADEKNQSLGRAELRAPSGRWLRRCAAVLVNWVPIQQHAESALLGDERQGAVVQAIVQRSKPETPAVARYVGRARGSRGVDALGAADGAVRVSVDDQRPRGDVYHRQRPLALHGHAFLAPARAGLAHARVECRRPTISSRRAILLSHSQTRGKHVRVVPRGNRLRAFYVDGRGRFGKEIRGGPPAPRGSSASAACARSTRSGQRSPFHGAADRRRARSRTLAG